MNWIFKSPSWLSVLLTELRGVLNPLAGSVFVGINFARVSIELVHGRVT